MERIVEGWVAAARANAELDKLQIGLNISPYKELKIAFDGYAEDDNEIEDINMESYAVYIHKDAASVDFVFPEHDLTPLTVVHRPRDEFCHFVWYDNANSTYEGPSLAECAERSEVPWAVFEKVINELHERYSA